MNRAGRPRGSGRARRFVAALALGALGAGGAPAQTPPQDLPRVVSELRVETDDQGVNLVSGRTEIALPVLSVPAAPNLRFDRVQNAAPYVVGRVSGQAGEPPVGNWSVHTGSGTEAFVCADWTDCGSVTGTGSHFRGPAGTHGANGTYRQAGTGATWHFGYISASGPGPVRQSYATNLRYPNGETITYRYATAINLGQVVYRPDRLESSLGYFIEIAYSTDDLGSPDWGRPAQATLYGNAAPGTPLARLTYAYSGETVAITDLGGRTFTCTGCVNALGADIGVRAGSSQLPGDSAPSRRVEALPSIALVGSVTEDGVRRDYSYSRNGGAPFLHVPSNSYWYTRLAVTGPGGLNQVYDFIQSGQRNVLARTTDSLGRTTSYTFDTAYRPTRIVYPEGNAVSVAYDDFGNVTGRIATPRPGSGLAPIGEAASYPAANCSGIPHPICWRPAWHRDALGRQTDFVHGVNGQLLHKTEPADSAGMRRRTIIDYAPSPVAQISRPSRVTICAVPAAGPGQGSCGTDREIRTEYEYWGETLLVAVERRIDPATDVAIETRYRYDPAGRLLATDGPLPGDGDTSHNRYDLVGQPTGTISADPDGAGPLPRLATRNSYDSAGRLIRVETGTLAALQSEAVAPADWTGFAVLRTAETRYAQNRKVREWVREGSAGAVRAMTDHSYDPRGRLECTAVRMNPAAFAFAGEPDACAADPPGPDGPDRIARNVYDSAGQRLQLREGVGTGAEAAEATWDYDMNGRVAAVIDGNGNRAELRHDGHGRPDRWTFPSAAGPAAYDDSTPATALATAGAANPADYEGYGHDAAGNRTSLRRRDGRTILYGYDDLDRMIVKDVPGAAGDVAYGYDLRNLQTHAVFTATGEGIANAYDGFGRLVSTTSTMGLVARALSYSYDAAGNRTRITHPDGTFFATAYDGLNRPDWTYDQTGHALHHYVHDAHGRLVARSQGDGGGNDFAWDPLGRLAIMTQVMAGTSADAWTSFAYNPAGQIARIARDNDAYAFTRVHPGTRPYETNGLNQYRALGEPGARATFGYDANGNLSLETPPAPTPPTAYVYDSENRLVSASGARNVALRYDPLGRLFSIGAAGSTTQFLHDGDALVAEYDGAGAITHRYVHGPSAAADDPLIDYSGASLEQPSYLHADHQGSIVAIGGAGAAMPTLNAYDDYGMPNVGNRGRFQYTGQVWLEELGLYYYKARLYSPALGRFLQVDPVGYDDQVNLYAYVGNDPVNRVDPTGRQSCPRLVEPCPDIRQPPRPVRDRLEREVRESRGDGERGGQAIRNNRTREITYRTGRAAGRGDSEEFSHNRSPEGSHTILRSHTHSWNSNERGLEGQERRQGQNGPSELDQRAMHAGERPIQTIGPNVTTTLFRIGRQDYLLVDSGNRAQIPDLTSQHIIVCVTEACPN